mgnify:FL=1
MSAIATNITTPIALATIARRAEAGVGGTLLMLGQAMPAIKTWDQPTSLEFAKLIDERVVAFLWHEHGPLIASHQPLADALAENAETIREARLNGKRWDFRAGREV